MKMNMDRRGRKTVKTQNKLTPLPVLLCAEPYAVDLRSTLTSAPEVGALTTPILQMLPQRLAEVMSLTVTQSALEGNPGLSVSPRDNKGDTALPCPYPCPLPHDTEGPPV